MPKFTIAPSAETDLVEIWQYIANRNEAAAGRFIGALAAKFELLADNRKLGKRQDGFVIGMRMFAIKNYNIYYFPTDDGVEIYRVLHGRRNVEELFGESLKRVEE